MERSVDLPGFKRFFVAILFSVFFACYVVYCNHVQVSGDSRTFFLLFYPATAALLAVVLQLFTEDFKNSQLAIVTQAAGHAVWFGVSLYVTHVDELSNIQWIAVFATLAVMVMSVFLICFYHKGDDMPFWSFSKQILDRFFMVGLSCGTAAMVIMIILETVEYLFCDNRIDRIWYIDIMIVCLLLVAPVVFIHLIPGGREKYTAAQEELMDGSSHFTSKIFILIMAIYLIVLYVYAAMILLKWDLPKGGVSVMVSGCVLSMLVLIFNTFPIQYRESDSWLKRALRWLPAVMLPLLVLMSVAIGRRLSDYGITVSRLYVVVFNVWCYAVCIGLLLCRNKRIWWIPASFAVLLLLTSVGPQGIPNMTKHLLKREVRAALVKTGVEKFPMNYDDYKFHLQVMDPDVAKSIKDKVIYLEETYGYETTQDIYGV